MRRNWLALLYEFASPTMQTWWLDGGPRGVNVSYVELMCGYFNDLALEDGLADAVAAGWLSADEVRVMAAFHDQANAYEAPSGRHEAILADPAWQAVVAAAQRAWHDLRDVVEDVEDRAAMSDCEARWGRIGPANTSQGPASRDRRKRDG